ncbi:MAG: hypothetical protein HYV04_19730 [Deltaproteobacteria bacterium]|nr:hypothetical protein [Deltaproteobacteria bacterium]
MKPSRRIGSRLAVALVLAAGWGYPAIGYSNHTPSGAFSPWDERQQELTGEVEWVDTRLQLVEVRTRDGHVRAVGYDTRTRMLYRLRDYPVNGLKPGDIVAMRVQRDTYGHPYTDLIDLREFAEERRAANAPISRRGLVEGTVEWLDYERGLFEVTPDHGRKIVVSLPYNPRRADADRFRDLRAGDYVKVEGRFVSRDRFELNAFVRG